MVKMWPPWLRGYTSQPGRANGDDRHVKGIEDAPVLYDHIAGRAEDEEKNEGCKPLDVTAFVTHISDPTTGNAGLFAAV